MEIFLIISIISWIVCGIFTGVVASAKGRFGFGWFVLGMLFGIFALLAVGFMPAKPGDVHAVQAKDRPRVKWVNRNGRDYMVPSEIAAAGSAAIEAYFAGNPIADVQ